MATYDTGPGYTATAKVLHWVIVALLVVQFIAAYFMPHIGRNTVPETLINLHLSVGVIVMVVALARLAWRLMHAEPAPYAGLPPWQVWSAKLIHWSLYLLLFVVPILGWLNASFRGFPVALFGLTLPALLPKRLPGWAWTGDVHEVFAYILLALAGLHIAAALYHYFVRRDGVLMRMLPGG